MTISDFILEFIAATHLTGLILLNRSDSSRHRKRTNVSGYHSRRRWVFDHPFFILLNVAVGGQWLRDPDANAQFPQ
jgi:hypothetical protein